MLTFKKFSRLIGENLLSMLEIVVSKYVMVHNFCPLNLLTSEVDG